MRYMLLIYEDPKASEQATEADWEKMMVEYNAFGEESHKAGVNKGGDALHPVTSATTVRVRDGRTLCTDGPFAETKEVLGGYYVVDCPTLDEAILWASKIPGAKTGSIEVRPIMEF